MLELIAFLGEIFELFLSWRLFVGIGITVLICWILFCTIPLDTMKWALMIPVGVVGIYLSFRWQIQAGPLRS